MPEYDPELITRPTTRLIPLLPSTQGGLEALTPAWEEQIARLTALQASDGNLPCPFTLWVTRRVDGVLISPRQVAPLLAEVLGLEPQMPISLPRDARPILHGRANGSLVRLWRTVPADRQPLEVLHLNARHWRWENRSYLLIGN